jgi:hypothetical protein
MTPRSVIDVLILVVGGSKLMVRVVRLSYTTGEVTTDV